MSNNENFNFFLEESLSSQVQQFHRELQKSVTFNETLDIVGEQIQIECFRNEDITIAKEIVLIISEVMKLPDNAKVRIAGNELTAEMVSLIYDKIEHENVSEVIRRYKEVPYEIKHTKTYLRTALYNSVFEQNARTENKVQKYLFDDKGETKCRGKNKRFRVH